MVSSQLNQYERASLLAADPANNLAVLETHLSPTVALALNPEVRVGEPKAKETGRGENHKMDSYTLERQKFGNCGVSEGSFIDWAAT